VAGEPVIGCTIHLGDPLLARVEMSLREPLQRFGGLPLILPRMTPPTQIEQILDLADGIQISGGADVHPVHYGEEPHALTRPIEAEMDAFEIGLARAALERGVPVLGICRGAQVLAVADGGRLTQDVETLHEGAHRHNHDWRALGSEPPGEHWHDLRVEPGSLAERWLAGGPARVNSFHHQSVAETGKRLRPTAWTLDGVVEAIERADGKAFAVGLQWHNELQWSYHERFLCPFEELIAAARAYRARRLKSRRPPGRRAPGNRRS
jgi:putative glutamine amidotransferase